MTRREEIEKAANEFYKGDEVSTFVVAAQWADKTMIEKAVEWMKEQVYQEYGGGPFERLISDERITDLRKAMEE